MAIKKMFIHSEARSFVEIDFNFSREMPVLTNHKTVNIHRDKIYFSKINKPGKLGEETWERYCEKQHEFILHETMTNATQIITPCPPTFFSLKVFRS